MTAAPPPLPALIPAATLAAFSVFVWTCCPTVHWLDGGELTRAAFLLGVAHPPGEAAWLAWARAFLVLPWGDVAFRANLSSALAGALVFPPAWFLARRVVDAAWAPDRGGVLAMAAAAAVTLGGAAWMQAVRAEVYALQAAGTLAVAAILIAGPASPRARMALGALGIGLLAANHPLLTVAALPGWGALAARSGWPGLGALGPAGAAGVLGFSAMVWLPLRARAVPFESWGVPDRASDFLAVVTGQAFAQNFSSVSDASLLANAAALLRLVEHHAGPALLPLSVGGAWLLARRDAPLAAALVLFAGGGAATVLPQNKVFLTNPDLHGYAVVALSALTLLAAAALAWIASAVARRSRWSGWVAAGAAVALGAPLVPAGRAANLADYRQAAAFASGLVDPLPQGATLLTAGTDAAFGLGYGRAVEGWRPDVVVIDQLLAGHVHYDRDWAERYRHRAHPGLVARLVHRAPGAEDQVPGPLFLELRERDGLWLPRLSPQGLAWRLGPGGAAAALDRRMMDAYRARLAAALPATGPGEGPRDLHGRDVATFHRAMAAAFFRARGRPDLAAPVEQDLRALDPAWDGSLPSFMPAVVPPVGLPVRP